MSEQRRSVLFDAQRDRQLRTLGIRAWAIVGIVAVAVVAYTAFSTFSTFILPLIVAVVLGIIFEPLASLAARFMPRHRLQAPRSSARSRPATFARRRSQASWASRSAAATDRASDSSRIPAIARRIGSRRARASDCFSPGMAVGTTLRESTPSATSARATSGRTAISPQTLTDLSAARAARATRLTMRSSAGW